jgi:hypothetical protein
MSEREPNYESADPYSGVNFVVYDASDFYPRGSLRPRSKINPPYQISKVPSNLGSIKDILDCVSEINPQSGIKRAVERLIDRSSDENGLNTKKRVEPEKVCKMINLNLLRDEFKSETANTNNGDIFKRGDKIVIIWPNDISYYLIVDLKRGELRYIWGELEDDKITKRYSNEKNKQRKIPRRSKDDSRVELEKPFESIDLKQPFLREAQDEGKRGTYPRETQNFFNRMRQADLEVENLLINNMNHVVPVSESLKRLARRKGRQYVRGLLAEIRKGGGDNIIGELRIDMLYENKWNGRKGIIDRKDTLLTLNLLLVAEKYYLNAILDFPWNKVGPEPFDALVDVFWFRFDFAELQNEWKFRVERIKNIRGSVYAHAQAERILEWVWKNKGYTFAHLKELRESNIRYKAKRVAKDMGPLYKFVDEERLKHEIINASIRSRPSGLTLLLWKTLKWASPSEWKAGHMMTTSDFRYEDPETWDEHFPDPYWVTHGDLQGRLVLAGETLSQPLAHLWADGSVENQIKKDLCYMAEQEEIELGIDGNEELIEKATLQHLKQADHLNYYELIAKEFQNTISNLTIKDIDHRISKMSSLQRVVALHRLGYSCSAKLKDDLGRIRYISKGSSIQNVITIFFDGKSDRYYKLLKQITKVIISG